LIQAPRFEFAGNSLTYEPDPNKPGMAKPPDFLNKACSDANFIIGVVNAVQDELRDFVSSNGATVGAIIGTVVAAGGAGLLALLAALAVMLDVLAGLLSQIDVSPRFGEVLNMLRSGLLGRSDSLERTAGLFIWQMIASAVFRREQGDSEFDAISYAVMEGQDYLDKSCQINVQSIEVCFDATDPMLIEFVDALLAFEIGQEYAQGSAFVGYISLRFTGPTRALLGQQRYPVSCSVEVAGLADVVGTKELIDFAITKALDGNSKPIMHWGQRNDSTRQHIEERFGPIDDPTCNLARWRGALSNITDNGRLNRFSSAFTRKTGLEVV
jgi:hypothetical protein